MPASSSNSPLTMFSLSLGHFSVISSFLCTHIYSSFPLFVRVELQLIDFSSFFQLALHVFSPSRAMYILFLFCRYGQALKLRGVAWACQETSLINSPLLTLILGVWLFFIRFCTRQRYHHCPSSSRDLFAISKENKEFFQKNFEKNSSERKK